MTMQHIIQSRRKALGLTQEHVAQALGVSVPAVSKWETGASCPDIALLPPLARLLGIDLNTLFDFQSSMTAPEIRLFCRDIAQLARTDGIAAAFDAAARKLCEFPRDEQLRHVLTIQLDGLLTFSGLPQEQALPLETRLLQSYDRLAESPDSAIRDSANYMLAGRFLRRDECEKAQEALSRMKSREELTGGAADKLFLQVELDRRQGNAAHAAEALQKALFASVNRVQILLNQLLNTALFSGDTQAARDIAQRSERLVALFELWPLQALTGSLEIAMAQKDAARCVPLLREMLRRMMQPWHPEETALFARVKTSDASQEIFGPRQALPAILSDMERNPAYGFLRDHEDFDALIDEYRRAAEAL